MAEWKGSLNDRNENYSYHDLGLRLAPGSENPPEWGCLIHPDELRHILFVGNSLLVTVNGEQLTDFQLKNWVDHNVRVLSNKLRYDIYPRLWRCRSIGSSRREIEPYAEWDDHYRYNGPVDNVFKVILRHRPVAVIHKWTLTSPFSGAMVYNFMDRMLVNYESGIIEGLDGLSGSQFTPEGIPITGYRASRGSQSNPIHEVDYSTGYDHASRVPEELKEVILNRMIIDVMSAYGDGVIGGMASSSVSVGVLSESVSTTQSATSAWFGARIIEKQKWEEDWFKTRAAHYRGIGFGNV